MKKSAIITIMIDDIKLGDIEAVLEAIEQVIAPYDNKRVHVVLRDDPLIRRP